MVWSKQLKMAVTASLTIIGMAVASGAHASIILEDTNFIASPTNFNGFEGIGPSYIPPYTPEYFPADTVYSEDGINVEYVGQATIWTTYTSTVGGQGQYGWYENGGGIGYTKITMQDGGDFQNIQFLAGNGNCCTDTVAYQLLENGTVVMSGTTTDNRTMSYLGFSGSGFDEIDIQAFDTTPYVFSSTNWDALAIDSIAVDQTATVPEPGTLALFGMGMAALAAGLMTRRRKLT